jgi:hypothetical protein
MKGRLATAPQSSAGFPILGTIRVGIRVESGSREYPSSLDYFICNDKYGQYFHEAYGEKPNTIEIAFASDDPQVSCNHRLEFRDNKGKLFATGDGREFRVWTGNEYETLTTDDYPDLMESIAEKTESMKGWEDVLTLQFLLLRVRSVGGLWRFVTRAKASTIPNIVSTFDNFKASVGTVTKTPFDLVVKKVTSQKPGSKSRYPVVELVPNIGAAHQQKLAELLDAGFNVSEYRGLLSEGAIEDLSSRPMLPQANEIGYDEYVELAEEKKPELATDEQKARLVKAMSWMEKDDQNDVLVNMDTMSKARAQQIIDKASATYRKENP